MYWCYKNGKNFGDLRRMLILFPVRELELMQTIFDSLTVGTSRGDDWVPAWRRGQWLRAPNSCPTHCTEAWDHSARSVKCRQLQLSAIPTSGMWVTIRINPQSLWNDGVVDLVLVQIPPEQDLPPLSEQEMSQFLNEPLALSPIRQVPEDENFTRYDNGFIYVTIPIPRGDNSLPLKFCSD